MSELIISNSFKSLLLIFFKAQIGALVDKKLLTVYEITNSNNGDLNCYVHLFPVNVANTVY